VTIERLIAVVMILGSSVLTAWASGDIAFPAILSMLGLLGVQRRFTWDIRPERHFVTPLLLLVLATLFAIHCHYAHVRADQAAAFAWQTIARYFLASMILVLFLRPQRTGKSGFRIFGFGFRGSLDAHPPAALLPPSSCASLPPSLGLFHLASTMAAGQVLLLDDRYVAFRLTELLSVALAVLYAIAGPFGEESKAVESKEDGQEGRKERNKVVPRLVRSLLPALPPSSVSTFVLVLLLVAVNLGWIGGSLLYRYVEVINFLPAWLSRGTAVLEGGTASVAHVGFSTSGKLASVLSIKEDMDSTPVLTITGDSNPTYLRAMAFETYRPSEPVETQRESEWIDHSYPEPIEAEQSTSFSIVGRTYLFRLHAKEALRHVTIRHEVSIGDALFTPLGTCTVETPFGYLNRDDDDIVSARNMRSRPSYQVGYVTPSVGNPPTEAQRRRMLAVPSHLDPQIGQRARQIFRKCTTTAEKIDAVTKYFQTNYTYSLGLEIPDGQDALNYFLLEASTGYCEYFASGAAVLLRFVEVPTRYVTGFLVTERSGDGRSWIARNMDAHAWAEAWDAEQGQWIIVEATTQEGLDDVSLADELARGAVNGRPFLTLLVQSLYEYGLFGVFGRLCASQGWFRSGVFVAATLAAVAWLVRRRRSTQPCHRPKHATAPRSTILALHRLLAAMDRRAQALGYRRQPEETLHAFATRLSLSQADHVPGRRAPLTAARCRSSSDRGPLPADEGLADWYFQYAGLRYGRTIDPAGVELLLRLSQKRPNAP
jgi:transglutaminase-like putative cysteine protease